MDVPRFSHRVLVVEDDEVNREILEDEFTRHGFLVSVVPTADDAVDELARRDFDVLVTDIEMPGTLSGIDLAYIARSRTPPLPTVLVTGRADLLDVELVSTEQLVRKPYALTHLVEATERLLQSLAA